MTCTLHLKRIDLHHHHHHSLTRCDHGGTSQSGKQIGAGKLLVEAYVDATSQAYGYIMLNLSPHRGDDNYIITSAIFPGEDLIVYLPL